MFGLNIACIPFCELDFFLFAMKFFICAIKKKKNLTNDININFLIFLKIYSFQHLIELLMQWINMKKNYNIKKGKGKGKGP
jgi:hypothetical protein